MRCPRLDRSPTSRSPPAWRCRGLEDRTPGRDRPALTLLVTTAAFARGYTRLDHRLEQSDRQRRIVLASITKTNEKQHRVVVAKIVKVNMQRKRLATEVSYLCAASRLRLWLTASAEAGCQRAGVRRLRRRHPPLSRTAYPAATFVEDAPPAPRS